MGSDNSPSGLLLVVIGFTWLLIALSMVSIPMLVISLFLIILGNIFIRKHRRDSYWKVRK
jgi:hypothetical protein